MLRKTLLSSAFVLATVSAVMASGPVQVKGYTKKDGTYVAPHTRALPGQGTTTPAAPTARITPPNFSPPEPRITAPATTGKAPRTSAPGEVTVPNEHQVDGTTTNKIAPSAPNTKSEPLGLQENDLVIVIQDDPACSLDKATLIALLEKQDAKESLVTHVKKGDVGKVVYITGNVIRVMFKGRGVWLHKSAVQLTQGLELK